MGNDSGNPNTYNLEGSCHTPVTQRLKKQSFLWKSTHMLKHGVTARKLADLLEKNGSGGGT